MLTEGWFGRGIATSEGEWLVWKGGRIAVLEKARGDILACQALADSDIVVESSSLNFYKS
jgi:hypothetical protein